MSMLHQKDITYIYNRIVKSVKSEYSAKKYDSALSFISASAMWMYYFNAIYSDYEIERIIKNIADKILIKIEIAKPITDRIVLIDNFGLDNRGLTQQYLRGLMSLGKEILYILYNSNPNSNSDIIRELKEYDKASIVVYTIDKRNRIDISKKITDDIRDFSPKDLLLHIAPWDVVSLMAISSITGVTKYNINLTDHAFWLGASFIDFNIEFRGYGEVLSIEKRGLKQSQLIRLPYYPIISKFSSFQGFPELPEGNIKVFCGGSEYKMLGRDGIFFQLMDKVLGISNDVHILVAGVDKNSTFQNFVDKMTYKARVHLIGVRRDINEVFSNSDIFLGSYPFPGGLMTQYAALNKLPILAYAEQGESNTIDALVNHFDSPLKTRRGINEFLDYAKRLITDPEYRKKEGCKCHDAMMDKNKFSIMLGQVLTDKTSGLKWELETPDYDYMVSYYLDVENTTHNALRSLIGNLKFSSVSVAPSKIPLMLKMGLAHIIRKFRKIRY